MVNNISVGLFGIGLDTYWDQFEGLQSRLSGYQTQIREHLSTSGVTIVDAGMVDNPQKAKQAADLFRSKNVDLVFIYISTYALSSTVLPVIQQSKAYSVILNIQPTAAVDYKYINSLGDRGKMTGEWLAHCQACSAPEIASVFNRVGVRYSMVTGYMGDKQTMDEMLSWVEAAKVAAVMQNNRMGILGHYYCGMLDVYTDVAKQSGTFGTHVELLEMCQLKELRDGVTDDEIGAKIAEFAQYFDISPGCSQYEIERAAKTSVALDKIISKNNLGSLAYYYEGIDDYQNIVTSLIPGCTLLTSKGIPTAGECEVKNAQAMKIMSEFGAGGSFSEFYAMDFDDDVVMLGHDGPAHSKIAEGRVGLVPLPIYHGKPGSGLSIQMSVKHGEVTLLSVCESAGNVFLLVAEGESVEGPVLEIGNTNSRYRFSIGARAFMTQWSEAGPSHHCAIGTGHIAGKIEKLAKMLGIPVVKIC